MPDWLLELLIVPIAIILGLVWVGFLMAIVLGSGYLVGSIALSVTGDAGWAMLAGIVAAVTIVAILEKLDWI